MVVRYEERFQEMMAQAEVSPDAMRGLLDRLETFVDPYCASLGAGERRRAAEYLTGLLSHLEHKTAEGIAYLLDRVWIASRCNASIGQAGLGPSPVAGDPRRQVGERLGEPDGVIVFDPLGVRQEGGGEQIGRRSPSSGAAGSATSRTARSVSTWDMSPGSNMPWSMSATSSRRSGRRTVPGAARAGILLHEGSGASDPPSRRWRKLGDARRERPRPAARLGRGG